MYKGISHNTKKFQNILQSSTRLFQTPGGNVFHQTHGSAFSPSAYRFFFPSSSSGGVIEPALAISQLRSSLRRRRS